MGWRTAQLLAVLVVLAVLFHGGKPEFVGGLARGVEDDVGDVVRDANELVTVAMFDFVESQAWRDTYI